MMLYARGRYGMFGGDVAKLGEDLQILKPNILISVPRLYNRFYATIQAQIKNVPVSERNLIEQAIQEKLKHLRETGQYKLPKWDNLVFHKLNKMFGGNIKAMWTGSAPTDPKVIDFLQIVFGCPLMESYGQTEGTGTQWSQWAGDPASGTVGGINHHLEWKLIDIPEMNYTSKDKDSKGRSAPRGEIVFRGNSVFAGYYKNDSKTKEA